MSADTTNTPAGHVPIEASLATISRDVATGIAQRVGAAAIVYYPEIHADDLNFTLADEIDWCLEGVTSLEGEDLAILRDVIARAIIDPTARRSKLNETLDVLTADEAE